MTCSSRLQNRTKMLSEKQKAFLANSYHSYNLAAGAVSSGKTFIQTLRWYKHIYDAPDGSLLMMSGKTGESLYDNVIRDLVQLNPGDIIHRTSPQRVYILSKNIEIACADANDERSWGKIHGKTVAGWLADEVTRHPRSFVLIAIKACRYGGTIWPKFWTCNPENQEHYILTEFILNEKIDLKNWEFILDDNPILSEEYKEEIKNTYTGVYYDRLILGKWVNAEGLVYPNFSKAVHVIKPFPIPKNWKIYRGIDWGFTNPFVCLWFAEDGDGRLYVFDEHYQAQRLLEYHAEHIKQRGHLDSLILADHDPQDALEMRKYGINTFPACKEKETGIKRVMKRLQILKDGRPRLYVFSNCIHTIKEFGLYEWPERREGKPVAEEPVKKNDHCMDTIRYIVNHVDRAVSWRPA